MIVYRCDNTQQYLISRAEENIHKSVEEDVTSSPLPADSAIRHHRPSVTVWQPAPGPDGRTDACHNSVGTNQPSTYSNAGEAMMELRPLLLLD